MNNQRYTIDSFKVSNFRSFCDEQEIKFNNSVIAFYGANASGKSNIWKAMLQFYSFVKNSTQANSHGTPYDPFLLRDGKHKEPLKIEIIFSDIRGTTQYRYMFKVDSEKVIEEAMYDLSTSRERVIFVRSKGYNVNTAKNNFGKNIFEKTRPDSLIITQAHMFNNKYAAALFGMIDSLNLIVIGGESRLRDASIEMLQKNPALKDRALDLLRNADFMIRDFNFTATEIPAEVIDSSPFSDLIKTQLRGQKSNSVQTLHAVRNKDGDIVRSVAFDMNNQESQGTNIFFNVIIPIIDCIDNGKMIYVDEFSSSLHIDICELIVKLFQNNKTGAKLIINTHDIGLMKNGQQGVLDRDSIMIVEKDMFEQTKVVPLVDKRSIRKDDNIEKKYRFGLYGGRPFINGD